MKTKHVLTLDDASRMLDAAGAEASRNGWAVTITVVDDGGHLVAARRLDGAPPSSVLVSSEKARTAALFRRATKVLEDRVMSGRVSTVALPGATPVQGGLPIAWQGEFVGGIGVSGVQSHEDEQVAQAGIDALGS